MIKIFQKFIFNKPKIITEKPFTRPQFKTVTSDGYVVHSDIPVRYNGGTAILSTVCDRLNEIFPIHSIYTRVKDEKGVCMGKYSYLIDPKERIITNGLISTNLPFQHKGIGEIMRLSSIMEFKENFLNSLTLESLPEAIPFHTKYKFEPNVISKSLAMAIFKDISDNDYADLRFRKAASNWVNKLSRSFDIFHLKDEDVQRINKFISNYIKANLWNWPRTGFCYSLPMVLKKEKLQENAGFYNELFKKHGIDYKV